MLPPATSYLSPRERLLSQMLEDLALANRALSNEGVIDAFGHVSCRHPSDPSRFLLSSALPPIAVQGPDINEYDLDGNPLTGKDRPHYGEIVIHSEIYRARPDVNAICHHHAPAIMPFCVTDMVLRPVCQTGALIGAHVPVWDSQTDFGDTNLLLTSAEHGQSLARSLGDAWIVLMRRHGATVVGRSLKEMAFRAMASTANARLQTEAARFGAVDALTEGEIALIVDPKPSPTERNWRYAMTRLALAEGRKPDSGM